MRRQMTHKEDTSLEACHDSSRSSANKPQDVVEGMPQKEVKRTKETHTLDTDDCVDAGVAEKCHARSGPNVGYGISMQAHAILGQEQHNRNERAESYGQ